MSSVNIVGVDEYPVTASVKINGPPGTGKTTQGRARVERLVRDHEVSLGDIAWVTYRRSLADEVLDDFFADGLVDEDDLENPREGRTRWISTAHAVAMRMCDDPQLNQERELVRERDYRYFFSRQYSVQYTTAGPFDSDFGKSAMDVIHWCIRNRVDFADAYRSPKYHRLQKAWPHHPPITEIARNWRSFKRKERLVEFHEFFDWALSAGASPPVDVLVVDEYHDVYPLMRDVLEMWIDSSEVAIVLGDPQQVINQHDGASPEYFRQLVLSEIVLKKTWRVPSVIWESAGSILEPSHDVHTPVYEHEGGAILNAVGPTIDRIDETGEWFITGNDSPAHPSNVVQAHSDKSLMMLARTQLQVRGLNSALERDGVIYRSQLDSGGWRSRDKLRLLYNALKRIDGVNVVDRSQGSVMDAREVQGLDNNHPRVIPADEAAMLLHHTPRTYLKLNRETLDSTIEKWVTTKSEIPILKIDELTSWDFWNTMASGLDSVTNLVDRQGEAKVPIKALKRAMKSNDEPTCGPQEVGDGLDNAPVTRTIHASKGSEAEIVVVYDGITSSIRDAIWESTDIRDNEHRVWWVGLTRASEITIVTRDVFEWTEPFLPNIETGNGVKIDG